MHQVLPLDHTSFGQLPRQTVAAGEAFNARASRSASDLSDVVRLCVPFAPDSNLVCLAMNPAGNRDVRAANRFVRELYDDMRCDPARPLQVKEFFGSMTTLRPSSLGTERMNGILEALGLDSDTLDDTCDHVLILRHTLMNPFLIDRHNGISCIDRYFDYLAKRVRALVAG